MDGTIVDTEPYWMRAEEEMVARFGVNWTHEDSLEVVGASLDHSARIFQARGVELSETEIIDTLTDRVVDQLREEVPWRPGARELLRELCEAGIPSALVTMSYRRMADIVVEAIGFDAFAAVVGGDSVTHGKPHPEPYLLGASRLGVTAPQCVAIEDSTTGLASAVASGAATIGVPLHVTLQPSSEYALWPSLAGRGISDLAGVYTAHTRAAANTRSRGATYEKAEQ
jgi:HAD superfamily hydrolase (TIGR01509 family)